MSYDSWKTTEPERDPAPPVPHYCTGCDARFGNGLTAADHAKSTGHRVTFGVRQPPVHAYGDEHGFVGVCGVKYPARTAAEYDDVTCPDCRKELGMYVEPDYDNESPEAKAERER